MIKDRVVHSSVLVKPEDPHLPVNGMFKYIDGQWQVNLRMLCRRISETTTGGRRGEWYTNSMNKLINLPDSFKPYYNPLRRWDSSDIAALGDSIWIPAKSALCLLTYGVKSYENIEHIDFIEKYTGQSLIVKRGYSRLEIAFLLDLKVALREIEESTGFTYLLKPQCWFGGRKYRVDFHVVCFHDDPLNTNKKYEYIIEFDEHFHSEPRQKKIDEARDAWFLENHPEITVIRVRAEEAGRWLRMVAESCSLTPIEIGYLSCLEAASTRHDQRLLITSETAKHGFNDMMNAALPETKQPLQCFRIVLERLGVPYEEKRTKQARMLVIEADAVAPIIEKYGYKAEPPLE
ncbi:Uncharacterised protein [Serratia fonticola]|uniref:hypothetical protein n=1 Tax=Serratia fonticola TaxID=47917 RepID=UPI0021834186|nr:hypothetical protein [Serratia fonticola]CAI2103759.1 Uncharacterised protein [Serratia fonticola]